MIGLALERVKPGDTKRRLELETLRSDIESLQASHAEKQRLRASETFNHFGRLPVEIASMIFCNVVEFDHTQVISLSHVCRDWRRVVVEMPALWSHLFLSHRKPVAKAKLWRERSKGKIKVLTVGGTHTETVWALEALADISFDHLLSLRLIEVDWRNFRGRLPAITNDVIRGLESFHIEHAVWLTGSEWYYELSDLQLRNLAVINSDLNWRSLSDHCTGLTTFCYQGWFNRNYRADLLALLHRNSKLEKLHLNMSIRSTMTFSLDQERRIPLPDSFSILPNLRELSLEGSELTLEALTSVMVPSKLQVLKIAKCRSPLDHALESLITLGIPQHLQELVIDRCTIEDPQNLVQLLHDARHLEVLRLTGLNNIRSVIDALSEPKSTSAARIPLPKLIRLDLSHCPEVRDGALIRIVKLRMPSQQDTADVSVPGITSSQQPLQLVSLVVHACDISPDVIQWLRKQVQHVSFVYATKKQARWKR